MEDFYYTLTASFNGGEGLEPVSNESVSDGEETGETTTGDAFQLPEGRPSGGGMGGKGDRFNRVMGGQSDVTVVGYSSDRAMTAFLEGTAAIAEGQVFAEGTTELQCIISAELATYNSLAVGDALLLANPNNEEETYTLTVVGTYTDSSANENSFSMMGMTSTDPANRIYLSASALQTILDASAEVSTTATDETTGREFETAVTGQLDGTYTFATAEDYYRFEEQARALGLEDSYTVASSDITSFEASLTPLNTLSTMAGYFLTVILLIGAVILVVLNIFNVRERKYEIGVLTAMGMKKGKLAAQLMTEVFVVTLVAVLLGVAIGGVSALPVTNALLEGQVTSQQNQSDRVEEGFGRDGNFGGFGGQMGGQRPDNQPTNGGGGRGEMVSQMFGQQAVDYVTEIHSAMNLTVVLQMLGIAVLLTLVAGTVSMLFVMRYEPLRILSNRD
ncbi:MAG: ABC transporter permease [Clostridia bacterium]|nr:ABC transporter permease [Clostridia bacterium]